MMKIRKLLPFFMVMLCMTIFMFPMNAFAASDSEPPTVTAKMTGNVLRIEASDNDTGVEAVYVDDNRINYRVDSALEIDPREYHAGNEKISVYAVDFAGNKSEIVEVDNPYYSNPTAQTPTESGLADGQPFTPDGTGTVIDNITDPSGKEFFTIQTPDGNVFYLIIDRSRDENGVYLLNAVTEDDLTSLAKEGDGRGGTSAVPTPVPEPQPQPTPDPQPEPTPEPQPEKESGGLGTIFLVLLIAAGVGGAGWYFKVYKPKQEAAFMSDDDDMDEDDEDEDGIDFEDEMPESEDGYSDDEDTEDYDENEE